MSNGEKPITHEELLREFQEDAAFAAAWAVERPKAHLAANVLRFRDARGWTQQELARRAQMRQPRIAEIERGDANPTLETISRIAHALGLSVDALVRDPDRGAEGAYRRSAPRLYRRAMKEDLFQELVESVQQMGAIMRGEVEPSRVFHHPAPDVPDVAALRKRFGLSQQKFAALLGISVGTLRNWEQGRRTPEGPAHVLLRVAARHPEAVLDAVRAA